MRFHGPVVMLACVVAGFAGCGDGDRAAGPIAPADVAPGTFTARMTAGADIALAAGGIRSVRFTCRGNQLFQCFDPPRELTRNGTFEMEVIPPIRIETAGSTQLYLVSGRFVTRDRIEGAIANGAGSPCNGDFVADRCDARRLDCADPIDAPCPRDAGIAGDGE